VDFVTNDCVIYESSKAHDGSLDAADAGWLISLWFEACMVASLLPRSKVWYDPACGLCGQLDGVDDWQNP